MKNIENKQEWMDVDRLRNLALEIFKLVEPWTYKRNFL